MGDASDFNFNEVRTGSSSSFSTHMDYPNYYYYWHPGTSWSYSSDRCKYCDGLACKTVERCPRVKKVEYFKDGSISKLEFHKVED